MKLSSEAPSGTSGDLLHLGGWAIIHAYLIELIIRDNTCEINLLDAFEKKDVHVDQFDSVAVPKTDETLAGK